MGGIAVRLFSTAVAVVAIVLCFAILPFWEGDIAFTVALTRAGVTTCTILGIFAAVWLIGQWFVFKRRQWAKVRREEE